MRPRAVIEKNPELVAGELYLVKDRDGGFHLCVGDPETDFDDVDGTTVPQSEALYWISVEEIDADFGD